MPCTITRASDAQVDALGESVDDDDDLMMGEG
jgi:hypothetical protein